MIENLKYYFYDVIIEQNRTVQPKVALDFVAFIKKAFGN